MTHKNLPKREIGGRKAKGSNTLKTKRAKGSTCTWYLTYKIQDGLDIIHELNPESYFTHTVERILWSGVKVELEKMGQLNRLDDLLD